LTTISSADFATSNTGLNVNFAYSVWLYINDWNYRYGDCKVVFGRMSTGPDVTPPEGSTRCAPGVGVTGSKPCPLVTLGRTENTLTVYLQTGETVAECAVPNIPIQRWVNFIMSVYGNVLDIYLDGKLVKTCMLSAPVTVTGDAPVKLTPDGGFDGFTAKFQYYPNPLNPQEAWNIYTSSYSNWFSIFNDYSVQVALLQNGTTKSSVTI
jgi:hypothetical protein